MICTFFSNSPGLDPQEAIFLQKEALDVLSLVQGLRNLTSPVGRLPADVLGRILTMRVSERDLLAASCVCRRWRATLTSSPLLWTRFQCPDVARTLQYLARSEPVPINVTADFYSDVQAVISLKSVTHRFRSLALRLPSSDLPNIFHQLATPAPLLERLEVHSTPQLEEGLALYPSIPALFLGGSTPALKSLHLNGINSKLNFSEFPSLTRLALITSARTFDLSELFHVFTSARQLEDVSVEFTGPTTPVPESQEVIRLPRMKTVSFSNTARAFPGRLLPLLDMPSVGEVRLDVRLPQDDTRTIRDFLPPRLRNFPHLLKVDNLTLGVPYSHCNVRFSGPGGVFSVRASRWGNRQRNDDVQSHWLDSLEPMSITEVESLTLCSYHPEKSSDKCPIFKLLATMDGLRSLVVERCDNSRVIEALSPATGGIILFPRLESLMFQLTTEPTTVFPGLVDMARARSEAGFPLNEVASDKYTSFRRPDIDALRCYVGCVQLNTGEDSHSSEPTNSLSYETVMVSTLFSSLTYGHQSLIPVFKSPQQKQGCRAPGCSPTERSTYPNEGKNPLTDLAVMYSREWP